MAWFTPAWAGGVCRMRMSSKAHKRVQALDVIAPAATARVDILPVAIGASRPCLSAVASGARVVFYRRCRLCERRSAGL